MDDFEQKVIIAIDSAELKGGTNEDKRLRFEKVLNETVNIIVGTESKFDAYFTYNHCCYFSETRNGTKYIAWIFQNAELEIKLFIIA